MPRSLLYIALMSLCLSSCASRTDCRELIPVLHRTTWNAIDATDTVAGYDRTEHLFTDNVFVPASWQGSSVTFVSLGANQEVWLNVNGQPAGYHAGGYTAFSFDITPLLRFGDDNELSLRITNAHNPDIPPLSADFTFFGGPYRDCYLLRPPFKYQKGMWSRHWEYVMNVNRLSQQLNNRLHELDPERYTFAAIHDYFREYHECGLDTCADVIGHNIYSGWYSGTIEDLDAKVERIRSQSGNRPMLISEYGADCDVRLRSNNPLKFDYTIDYAMLFHRHYLDFLLKSDLVAGGTAWNLNDFHSESRGGAIPHMNLKGLVTTRRQPKATYYFYQTRLLHHAALRREAERKMNDALEMPVPSDMPLCVLLGSNRYFTDDQGTVWQPDQEYNANATHSTGFRWGTIAGTPYVRKTDHGPLPASDVTILGDPGNEPLYQTARLGIEQFRADVPDGNYNVTLYLAELETIGEQEMSVYNLGNKALDTGFRGRRMTITVNGQPIFTTDDNLPTYRAKNIVCQTEAKDGNGIIIALHSSVGTTILNAVKISNQ